MKRQYHNKRFNLFLFGRNVRFYGRNFRVKTQENVMFRISFEGNALTWHLRYEEERGGYATVIKLCQDHLEC